MYGNKFTVNLFRFSSLTCSIPGMNFDLVLFTFFIIILFIQKTTVIMSKHYANARWQGNLVNGKGTYKLKTSGHEGSMTFSSRF